MIVARGSKSDNKVVFMLGASLFMASSWALTLQPKMPFTIAGFFPIAAMDPSSKMTEPGGN